MLDPGACCHGLPFPGVLNENGKENGLSLCVFLPGFSDLGDHLRMLESPSHETGAVFAVR